MPCFQSNPLNNLFFSPGSETFCGEWPFVVAATPSFTNFTNMAGSWSEMVKKQLFFLLLLLLLRTINFAQDFLRELRRMTKFGYNNNNSLNSSLSGCIWGLNDYYCCCYCCSCYFCNCYCNCCVIVGINKMSDLN